MHGETMSSRPGMDRMIHCGVVVHVLFADGSMMPGGYPGYPGQEGVPPPGAEPSYGAYPGAAFPPGESFDSPSPDNMYAGGYGMQVGQGKWTAGQGRWTTTCR